MHYCYNTEVGGHIEYFKTNTFKWLKNNTDINALNKKKRAVHLK